MIILKDIEIFCGVNSVGMPFTKENKYHIGYYDIVVEVLRSKGYNNLDLTFQD